MRKNISFTFVPITKSLLDMNIYSLNCNGRLLTIDKPIVMGILNATPDSFYNKGHNSALKDLLSTADKMLKDGATILDIGGMSTRPGHHELTEQEEIDRIAPIVAAVRRAFPSAYLSIDTFRANVALTAAEEGIDMINDISGGTLDDFMIPTVATLSLPYIAMHMQGALRNMQDAPCYEDVVKEILDFGATKVQECRNAGIKDVMFDPGFGFGKTIAHNFELLKGLHAFEILDVPILVGLSRKSMLYKLLEHTPEAALNATSIVNTLALQQGAHILRVHDVKEAMECIRILDFMEHI